VLGFQYMMQWNQSQAKVRSQSDTVQRNSKVRMKSEGLPVRKYLSASQQVLLLLRTRSCADNNKHSGKEMGGWMA
jgi:hypothetical protein